ncbi:hypothetical protein ACFVMC_06190 [Nocardia sp. NPDC127579]|uniref:hypothetical protein n=1 Tax=Nocardia sp. NPDC127579 TaxID=3345402 RepID=UPI00362BBB21
MASRSDPQPPFSPELLADLHADNLAPEVSAELWPVVRADPQARAYLDSLDEVNNALRALADREPEPMPGDVSARLDSFLAGLDDAMPEATVHRPLFGAPSPESGSATAHSATERPDAPISLADRRERRDRRLRWLAAAAAAVVLLTGAGITVQIYRETTTTPGTPTALPPTPPTPDVDDDTIPAAFALGAIGRFDVTGTLATRDSLNACVAAAGLGDRKLLGSTDMRYKGADAVLILLSGADGRKITALVVGTTCTPDDPQVKNVTDIG